MKIGDVLSATITVWVLVLTRPAASWARQITVFFPGAKEPCTLFVTITGPPLQTSAAWGSPIRCSAHDVSVTTGGGDTVGLVTGS